MKNKYNTLTLYKKQNVTGNVFYTVLYLCTCVLFYVLGSNNIIAMF